MASVRYSNNAASTLSATITSTTTSLSVASGTGSKFPAISAGDYFYITLLDIVGDYEIMKVTARSADTLTVVRGQDGTTARSFVVGDKVELRMTKAMLDDMRTELTNVQASSTGPGTLYGRTDTGIYSAPQIIEYSGHWTGTYLTAGSAAITVGATSTVISSDTYNSGGAGTIADAINNNTLQVGQNLKIVVEVPVPGNDESGSGVFNLIDLGTITALSANYEWAWYYNITVTNPTGFNGTGATWRPPYHIYGIFIWKFVIGGTVAENVTLGHNAGVGISSGGENVIIGDSAGNNISTGRNNVIIGNSASASAVDVSNEITLGNSLHTKTRLFGSLAMGGSSEGTSGQVLTSQGAGTAPIWAAANALPSQTGNSGKFLTTDGSNASWATVNLSSYLDSTTAASTYLTQSSAASTYQTQSGMSAYLTTSSAASTYQPLDGDLTSIAGLTGTTGLLKKTAANTWALDTTSYLTLAGGTVTGDVNVTKTASIDTYYTAGSAAAWRFIFADSTNSGGHGTGASGFGIYRAGNADYSLKFATDGTVNAPGGMKSAGNAVLTLAGGTVTGALNVGAAIGGRGTSLSVSGSNNSSAIATKSGTYSTVFAVLPWGSSSTYLSTGTYYDGGAWVHASDSAYNALLMFSGQDGGRWYASNNSTASWNVVSSAVLWDNTGKWTGSLNAATGAQVNSNTILHAGNYSSYALPLSGGTITSATTINTTTPGTGTYGLNLANAGGNADYASGLTWSWASSGAQAGIYVQSSGAYGTKMYIATTDSFAAGAKTAIGIDHMGNTNIARGALTQGGNQVLHAGNYTSYTVPWIGDNYNTYNRRLYGGNTGQMGLLGVDSGGTFKWQIYGGGGDYGFLDGPWGNWDIRKTPNGNMSLRVSGTDYTVVTAANYSNYALPLSGGALTGYMSGTSCHFSTYVNTSGPYYRNTAGAGYFNGQYPSAESVSTTGVIYTIGGTYVPTATSYNNMYGVAYSYSGSGRPMGNVGGIPSDHWAFVGLEGGTPKWALSTSGGSGYFTGHLSTQASLYASQGVRATGISRFYHANGGEWSILGTAFVADWNTYLHVKTNLSRDSYKMVGFRASGFFPYSYYADCFMGAYMYGDNSSTPYGQAIVNMGSHSCASNMYYSSDRYVVLVYNWPTPYNGLMIEYVANGGSYGSQTDISILSVSKSSGTSGVY